MISSMCITSNNTETQTKVRTADANFVFKALKENIRIDKTVSRQTERHQRKSFEHLPCKTPEVLKEFGRVDLLKTLTE